MTLNILHLFSMLYTSHESEWKGEEKIFGVRIVVLLGHNKRENKTGFKSFRQNFAYFTQFWSFFLFWIKQKSKQESNKNKHRLLTIIARIDAVIMYVIATNSNSYLLHLETVFFFFLPLSLSLITFTRIFVFVSCNFSLS